MTDNKYERIHNDGRRPQAARHVRNIILWVCFLIAVFNVYSYFRLRRQANNYLKQTEDRSSDRPFQIVTEEPVDLIGLLDSYGVPYSPEVDQSFMDFIALHPE